MKKVICMFLSVLFIMSLAVPVFATDVGPIVDKTTEELLLRVLNKDDFVALLSYGSFEEGLEFHGEELGVDKLLEREDALYWINVYIQRYTDLLEENEIIYNLKIDDITEDMDVGLITDEQFDNVICLYLKISLLNNLYDTFYSINEIAMSVCLIETKYGNLVQSYKDRDWENDADNSSYLQEDAKRLWYHVKYSLEEVSGITPVFNCHSYAWFSQDVNTNVYWIEKDENVQVFLDESTSGTHNVQPGVTRVVYYNNGKIEHSALVYSVKANGDVDRVISKWGNNCVYIHTIEDCEYYHTDGTTVLAYRNY